MYCGINDPPKGRTRGTAEECLKANQVRYYGKHHISKEVLAKAKEKPKLDLVEQKSKLKIIELEMRYLINQFKKYKLIANHETATKTQKKNADKEMDKILKKKPILQKKLKTQSEVVNALYKQQKIDEEEAAKKTKMAKKKTKK